MYLELFRWGPWTEGKELFNALERGFLPAAYEYLYLTGDKEGLRRTVLKVLDLPLKGEVRERLLWLLRVLDRIYLTEREDDWIMVRIPGRVIGWIRRW